MKKETRELMNISFAFSPDFFLLFKWHIIRQPPRWTDHFQEAQSFGDKLRVFTLFTRTNGWRMAERQGKSSLRTSKFISWLTLFKYVDGTRDDNKPLDRLRRKSQSISFFRTTRVIAIFLSTVIGWIQRDAAMIGDDGRQATSCWLISHFGIRTLLV